MLRFHHSVVALALFATVLPCSGQRSWDDELDKSFNRWIKDFKAGRIEPTDKRGPRKKPYLSKTLLEEVPLYKEAEAAKNRGSKTKKSRKSKGSKDADTGSKARKRKETYHRLREARELFGFLKKRGSPADGMRFLQVIEVSFKKKGGKLWEVTGKFSRFRREALDVLEKDGCPPDIQRVLAERLEKGLVEKPVANGAAKKQDAGEKGPGANTLSFPDPALGAVLLPLVGSFNQPDFLPLLEKFLRVDEQALRVMAAEALARMGNGPSVAPVARVLHDLEYPEDIGYLASSLGRLALAESPKPSEKNLKYALGLVQDKLGSLKDWRARIALVPITRMIRSRSSIPLLIRMLEDVNTELAAASKKKSRGSKAGSGTLLASVQEALVDLTGTYIDPRLPGKWREWWQSVAGGFVLPPQKKELPAGEGATRAAGFFGIPVSGNRVFFVLDISGSMAWPMRGKDYVKGKTGRGAVGSFESRFDRAMAELKKAIEGLPPDSKFNVAFFSDHVKTWKKKLVWSTSKNKKAFLGYLGKIFPTGGTMLYDGLDAALEIDLDKPKGKPYENEVDEVFLLSDGAPNLGTLTDTRQILEVVRTWTRGAQIRIHGVYIGDEVVDEDFRPPNMPLPPAEQMRAEDFMRKLAEENHGKFHMPQPGGQ